MPNDSGVPTFQSVVEAQGLPKTCADGPLSKQFVLIIGASRSGSSWLQYMLSRPKQVCTSVELAIFSDYVAPWVAAWNVEISNRSKLGYDRGLPYLWSEQQLHEFLTLFLDRAYRCVLGDGLKATHILDKTPDYSLHVKTIASFVPNFRFIHLIRDGRDSAASLAAVYRHGWGARSIRQAAIFWQKAVLEARSAAEYEGRYLEVRYEGLLSQTTESLAEVFEFCDLSIDREEVAEIADSASLDRMKADQVSPDASARIAAGHYRKGKSGGWQDELGAIDRYTIDRVCGDLLVELGYAEPGWWKTSSFESMVVPPIYFLKRAGIRLRAAWQTLTQ